MLKITTDEMPDSITMKLEGSIRGPWVEELNKAWLESMSKIGKRTLVLELAGVAFADGAGRELLINIRKSGAELAGATSFIRHLVNGNGTQRLGNSDSDKGGK